MLEPRPFTVVDLFGGAGGTGLGFVDAGFSILAAVDVDEHAAETYYMNLGVEVTRQDITTLSPAGLREAVGLKRGELDVLAGCPPCQGFTRLRNSSGARDPRNNLVFRYLQFVSEFRPRFAVFENVSGMLDTKHGRTFHSKLLQGFRKRGYTVSEQVFEAADFGVPQFRRRVIIIAARGGYKVRVPAATHGAPDSEAVLTGRLRPWITVREAIGGGKFPALAPGQSNERGGLLPNHLAASTGARVCRFLRRVPRDGGSRSQVEKRYLLPCHRGHTGHADTYGRLSWASPANTITTGCTNPSKGRFVHPTQTRALSFREAATLQGFPMEFRFYGKCIERQIGNAVPPPLALAIAEALKLGLLARRRDVPVAATSAKDIPSGRAESRLVRKRVAGGGPLEVHRSHERAVASGRAKRPRSRATSERVRSSGGPARAAA
jgi:DNA (cytosine-5)-methyltransferase 1